MPLRPAPRGSSHQSVVPEDGAGHGVLRGCLKRVQPTVIGPEVEAVFGHHGTSIDGSVRRKAPSLFTRLRIEGEHSTGTGADVPRTSSEHRRREQCPAGDDAPPHISRASIQPREVRR